jgi:signal transduction histidine kinase
VDKVTAMQRIRHSILANSRSIRWRLPLSYAGIALLTVVALVGFLLVTLNAYYSRLEHTYLERSATVVARQAEDMYRNQLSTDEMQSITDLLSFLAQARVRLLDTDGQVIADSGPFNDQLLVNVNFDRPEPGSDPGGAPPSDASAPYLSMRGDQLVPQTPSSQQVSELPATDADPRYRYPMSVRWGVFGQLLSEDISPGERSDQSATIPVKGQEGKIVAYLELSEGPAFGSEIVGDVAERGEVAGLIAVVIAAAAGVVISRNISRPVLDLADVTRQMAHGDLTARARINRRDEFGLLAGAFNAMAGRVELTVTTLRQFVADAAHELNTPLTALHTNLELTVVNDMPDSARSDIEQALAELNRLEKLTRSLLMLARLEAPDTHVEHEPVDLSMLARQMNERYASRAEQARIALSISVPAEPVMIAGDQAQITRMLDNLLDNALKFTPAEGRVELGLLVQDSDVKLWVQDTGIGIPENELPRLFSRFHRGRNAASFPGNGLGLVITKAIVTEHDGRITVKSDSQGTCFTVHLPIREGEKT